MAQAEKIDRLQMIRSFVGSDDNLRMWGNLYTSQTGRTIGGWLVNSWSELGAPYWQPQMRWFEKGENKFYHVKLGVGPSMNLHGEDEDIDPKRASFIRKMMDKWELEWLQDESGRG
jgi:hypothetical protein